VVITDLGFANSNSGILFPVIRARPHTPNIDPEPPSLTDAD
jgi:hypothetical protein